MDGDGLTSYDAVKAGRPDRVWLHPTADLLVTALAERVGSETLAVVRGPQDDWLTVADRQSGAVFVEAERDSLLIFPVGPAAAMPTDAVHVDRVGAAGDDGLSEVVVDLTRVARGDEAQIVGLMATAHRRCRGRSGDEPGEPAATGTVPTEPPATSSEETAMTDAGATARMRADVSSQWSWASSVARIPQVSGVLVELVEPVAHARLTVSVSDGDVVFGSRTAYEGPVGAGPWVRESVHVPLSARVMSQVTERQAASCVIELVDAATGKVLSRHEEAIDIQPRDLWLWTGDPRRNDETERLRSRVEALGVSLQAAASAEEQSRIQAEIDDLGRRFASMNRSSNNLARALLAAFVRPNHPDIAVVAREAAAVLGRNVGEAGFHAFQMTDPAEVEKRVEESVTATYEALVARGIAYSEPPPGWDYEREGQRIRDHGDVARGGLGTCMDTTVLMAAVLEQIGLLPVLVLVPGHIFVGYWRRDPAANERGTSEWYPGAPVVDDLATVRTLVDGGWLGVIETTTLTAGKNVSADQARSHAVGGGLSSGLSQGRVDLIDVAAARRAGVSPLPAVSERADGVTEVVEYRLGGDRDVTEVEPEEVDLADRDRHVDHHPPRYRTWKASLFSLNATNALLNLRANARVQPLVLPPEGLGMLEDKLNQDASFTVRSGFDVPEVWRARDVPNAVLALRGDDADPQDVLVQLRDRNLYVQRMATGKDGPRPVGPDAWFRELRSMANNARTAREERGMNPLFLCIGLLRWEHKPGAPLAEAPLLLVPVHLRPDRGRKTFSLSLDTSQRTTANAALIEWLRREHGFAVPSLDEPVTDRAGIDVDGILADVRRAVADRGLPFEVAPEARLATLDLTAFRMWQDLDTQGTRFLERPLVRHLVETPTERFQDPVGVATPQGGELEATLDQLETPIPADATQKRAVLWAREGHTFVLQGPPGTGKSQTITNIVAECVLSGMRVLFVAEKGTALAVVQRRLDAIGLGPFTLNLHHEGSNAAAVRTHLRTSLESTVQPDPAATESARRRLRNARFALAEYPAQLHEPNAAGMSAYGARDELLVLGEGPALPVTATTVAHHADQLEALRELCRDLPRWTAAAGTRPDHPWRLAGRGAGDPFAPEEVAEVVRTLLAETRWARSTGGAVRRLLDAATHPGQLRVLAAGAHDELPHGAELDAVLDPRWRRTTADALAACRQVVDQAAPRLRGFPPAVVDRDLRSVLARLDAADASGVFGRGKRRVAALAPLSALAPAGLDVAASDPRALLTDLVAAQDAAVHVRNVLGTVAGLGPHRTTNPFEPGALEGVRQRLDAVAELTEPLRASDDWSRQVAAATRDGVLTADRGHLAAYAEAWDRLCELLGVQVADLDAWRSDDGLVAAVSRHESVWRQHVDHERLLPLQRWCALVRVLEPMRSVGLDEARAQLLEGRLAADVAEEALARGIAQASLSERVRAAGLDRFDPVAHDQRVTGYAAAQAEVRRQWVTDGPARLLTRRETGGSGHSTGGLARELEKTSRKLGTRAILRKHGAAVQEVTPLFLCSPSSVVDLVDPELLDFDVVVFDEASQITVPEAVGALGRAKSAVVVGDSKQMPPTRVVAAQHPDDALEEDEDDVVEDQESILSECELARVPTLALDWHYRSQDEALIAFSNRTYYRSGLSSFPTPTLMSSETGVDFRRVEAGQYFRAGSNQKAHLGGGVVAGNNTNPAEALEIVAYVEQMVERAGEDVPSVGVVTFNESQRQLIEDLLVTRAHPGVLRAMDETHTGRGEALFVKALEQVQGDERDVVLFSVAFSKQPNGRIPTNFGPLSNSGGERRLNVAITRARRRNVVFCSFDPSELEVSAATYNGPRDLKAFLAFAKGQATSSPADEDDATRVVLRDRHRDDVAAALRAAGLTVLTDVGMSGFRLDLVVCRRDDPARPLLPVLLDGEGWRTRSTVSDRDVLPVEVLENLMGWPKVLRIWWPMWLQNRRQVVDELVRQVATVEESVQPEPEPVAVSPADLAPPSSELGPEPDGTWRVASIPDAGGGCAPATADVVSDGPAAQEGPAAPPVPPVSAFVAAHVGTVAGRQVLDALPAGWAAELVRTEVLDVIATEGPVEVGRLTRTVARRFDLTKVRAARAELIAELVPHGSVRSGPLGSFAWPSHLDPASWAGYRTGAGRPLEEVAPEEIANAMRGLLVGDALSGDDVLRRTADLFGVTRLGAHVRARLAAVRESLGPEAGTEAVPDVGLDR